MTLEATRKKKTIEALRWIVTTVLFYLVFQKLMFLDRFGLEPYRKLVSTYQLPEILGLYGVLALLIELVCIIGLWVKPVFNSGFFLMSSLTIAGAGLSIWSLIFKLRSGCGCGLMGENEYFILAQKLAILLLLIILYKGKEVLFNEEEG